MDQNKSENGIGSSFKKGNSCVSNEFSGEIVNLPNEVSLSVIERNSISQLGDSELLEEEREHRRRYSSIIGALKLVPTDSNEEERNNTESQNQAEEAQSHAKKHQNHLGTSEFSHSNLKEPLSPSKTWKFEKNENISGLLKESEPISSFFDTTHCLEHSPNPKEKSERSLLPATLEINNFFAFDARASNVLKSNQMTHESSRNSQPRSPKATNRRQSMKTFREQQRLFDLVVRGRQSDLNLIQEIILGDFTQNIYDHSDPAALINRPDHTGQRPLYLAIKNGNLNVVKLLVQLKANVNLASEIIYQDGKKLVESNIEVAAKWSQYEITEYLLGLVEWEEKEIKEAISKTHSKKLKRILKTKRKKREKDKNSINDEVETKKVKRKAFLKSLFSCFYPWVTKEDKKNKRMAHLILF